MTLYCHLLVPSDGTERSEAAISHAVALAGLCGARISFLHVQPPVPVPVVGMGEMLDPSTMDSLLTSSRQETERILGNAMTVAAAAGITAGRETVLGDLPHRAIIETAKRLGCDLIVMASHGRRGLSGLLLGSETHKVLVQAPCPVLVHR